MTPPTSPRPLASGLVALAAAGALLLGATPALAGSTPAPAAASGVAAGDSERGFSIVGAAGAIGPQPTVWSSLLPDQALDPGDSRQSSESGGGYRFVMQTDGNAVTYAPDGHAVFSTGTAGRGHHLVMQEDGNVVVYSEDDVPVWSTGTDDEPDSFLIIQEDGNLVLYRGPYGRGAFASPAWASSTGRRIPEPARSGMFADGRLYRGHQLTSESGLFRAVMQEDGDLVGYGPAGPIWSTGTRGTDNRLVLQDDGNAVIYGADDSVKWASGTRGQHLMKLGIDDTGRLLIVYGDDDDLLWSSQAELPGPVLYSPTDVDLPNGLGPDDLLRSADDAYRAVMQADGNFVVYGPSGAVWSTRTAGADSALYFDTDGVLRITSKRGTVTWKNAPAAGAVAPIRVVMQNDGNLVEYDNRDRPLWSTR